MITVGKAIGVAIVVALAVFTIVGNLQEVWAAAAGRALPW